MSGYFPAFQCPEIAAYGNLHTCTHKSFGPDCSAQGMQMLSICILRGLNSFFNGKSDRLLLMEKLFIDVKMKKSLFMERNLSRNFFLM